MDKLAVLECEKCHEQYEVDFSPVVLHAPLSKEDEERLIKGEVVECPKCHEPETLNRQIVYVDDNLKLVICCDEYSNHAMNVYNIEHGKGDDIFPLGYKYIGVETSQDIITVTTLIEHKLDYRAGLLCFHWQCDKFCEDLKEGESITFILLTNDGQLVVAAVKFSVDGKSELLTEPFDMKKYERTLKYNLKYFNKFDPFAFSSDLLCEYGDYEDKVEKLFVIEIFNEFHMYLKATDEIRETINVGDVVKATFINQLTEEEREEEVVISDIQEWNIARLPLLYGCLPVITEVTHSNDNNEGGDTLC